MFGLHFSLLLPYAVYASREGSILYTWMLRLTSALAAQYEKYQFINKLYICSGLFFS